MWLSFSLPLALSTFGIIFIAELPDKTAIAALVLATRYKARDVVAGAWLALLVQTVIAVIAGGLLTLLPALPVRIAAGLGFIVFAYFAFTRKEDAEEQEEERDVANVKRQRPVWLTSFLIVFAAEWGDLTQLATAALVAQEGHPLAIGVGALLALWSVSLIAVVAGSQLEKYLSPKVLNLASGIVFAGIGLFIIVSAIS
jgi:putative Ca2+/H+ antiporter (TMEM165/GDT1 family)